MALRNKKTAILLVICQIVFIILFGVFVDYAPDADARHPGNSHDQNGTDHENNSLKMYYPMFQDVHVMIFVGFGFLMTFLRRYGFGAVGLNFLLAAFVIQWSLLVQAFFEVGQHGGGRFEIDVTTMLTSDFACAAVLISFGSLLGKASPIQLITMALIEIVIFTINEHIGVGLFSAVDVGGSMYVHAFGAYYGLAVARVLYKNSHKENPKEESNYHSDLFAMIGTIFLWMYWPSFNSALAPADDQHRAVLNTYLALAACCVVTFAISSLTDAKGHWDMVHIQNATLAGGVAVGTSADMMLHPFGALMVGSVAGMISTLGYKYLTPFMANRLKIHDTCGVHNLHGMPGVMAGVIGAIMAGIASTQEYEYEDIHEVFSLVQPGIGRSAMAQGAYQALALAVTLVFAIVTGALTGLLLRLKIFDQPEGGMIHDDAAWWGTPEDFTVEVVNGNKSAKGLMTEMEDK
ncbi:hypothetical protein CAPTEDRAFT_104921 [Capitella teleta]|uniref:Ammonium transporter AmtB-like domain-containing protein n=1 Tax=Capitella teleta TaxID=283909 RepID=R7TPU2_CAPTE|nr:hypothetical protein CAPTEDRAFT_104921 [Capitella teleta]|eukprot:ELT93531.1 hypothetical protein CAPTEDRAFT_104921 [Capitella teleta]